MSADVVVVGAGIIGAAVAWRAAQAGLTVTVLDPAPGSGATHAAAGMLAPAAEAWFGEADATRLGLAAVAAWDGFAIDLAAATGSDGGLRGSGALLVAYDADDAAQLRRILALHDRWELGSAELSVAEARRTEPLLGPRVSGAAWLAPDRSADPRTTTAALLTALEADARVSVVRRAADRLLTQAGCVVGVLDDDGGEHRAGTVVLAAGWRSAALVADLPGVPVPVRPVRGQTLRLDAALGEAPSHVVRGIVQGRPIYVVPREPGSDGRREVVVGATSDEGPDDGRPTAGGAFALLRDARALLPALDEAALVEITSRARPGSPDNAPLVGPTDVPGLVLATGHHRNGILLAPITAEAVVAHLVGAPMPDAMAAADPRRFTPLHATTRSLS
ncbi:glycine oxidase ThiO [Xylanimonas cellulosilytica DSM 15894]|uniref:glycine oxidase n=1 Tax=Xylanimonas cellulosilytica (strain DSM 15894 / JCM 12276 / CECT 5975 / KCTC 9989 / LMG 20990 / NBRC 107835 / XIL07) TaxID=446471 RepID=D1BRZ5_XYLCX|nr:glycine oxidase ThiO [Xylanimonas cellulosilytica]ACZ30487.1 glycine oxidase ThiO [Xylanimonas cellulosilytica DSM 15894]